MTGKTTYASADGHAQLESDRADRIATSLTSLLAQHPGAWVGAMGPDALYVPVPAGEPFDGHRVLEGRWAFDHMASPDRPAFGAAWRRSLTEGTADVTVQLVSGGTATLYIFDVNEHHGVHALVAVEHGGALMVSANQESHPLPPRHCRMLRDESGRITELDSVAESMLGWPARDLIGAAPLVQFHPDDHARVIDVWLSTLSDASNGHRCRARILRSDGTWAWMELTTDNRLDDVTNPRVECEMLDVSDEMAAHEAVRAREQLLRRLAESLPHGVLQLDPDRQVVYKNDYLSHLLGESAATSSDQLFAATIADDQAIVHGAIGDALDHREDGDVTIRVALSGDDERVMRVITKALVADSGAVSGVIVSVSDVSEETKMSRELERRATFDALTGCHNRASILSRLEASLYPRGGDGTAVVFLDLDGFKGINDRCGHPVGDDVLRVVAECLMNATRGDDEVGRIGGDEFLVVCHDVSTVDAMHVAHRIAAQLARHRAVAGSYAPLRASIGVACATSDTLNADVLVARADEAMYASKRGGRGEPHLWVAR